MPDDDTPKVVADLPLSPLARKRVGDPADPYVMPTLIGDGIMAASGMTVLYGVPGAGKGLVAVYLCGILQDEGIEPVIADFERNEYEWHDRLYGRPVDYLLFDDANLGGRRIRDRMQGAIEQYGYGALIIDSASRAGPPAGPQDNGGLEAANVVVRFCVSIGIPVLLLAHSTKGKSQLYGSMGWAAGARAIWQVIKKGNHILMRNEKMSAMPEQADKHFDVIQRPGGRPALKSTNALGKTADEPAEKEKSQADLIVEILGSRGRSLTRADILDAWAHDYEGVPLPSNIRVIMSRLVTQKRVQSDGVGRDVRYWVEV